MSDLWSCRMHFDVIRLAASYRGLPNAADAPRHIIAILNCPDGGVSSRQK